MTSVVLAFSLFALLTSMGRVRGQDTVLDRGWLRAQQPGNSGLPLNKGNLLQRPKPAQTAVRVSITPENTTKVPLSTVTVGRTTTWSTWSTWSIWPSTTLSTDAPHLDLPSLNLPSVELLPLFPPEVESPPSASTSGDENQSDTTLDADNTKLNQTSGTEDPSVLDPGFVNVALETESGSLPAGTMTSSQDHVNGVPAVSSISSLLVFCISMYSAVI